MAQRNRLTNNSDETDIASLISGDQIFSIPYFQRPYKWKPERLKRLNADILDLVDEASDFHFLGAMILHGRRSNPSDPFFFDVIDGQQRLTTLFLYLCATVKTLAGYKEYDEASGLFLKYLVINREVRALSNIKLHSCKDDRSQLNYVFLDLLSDEGLKNAVGGFKLRPLPKSGAENGTIRKNYQAALNFLKVEYEQSGIERIRAIYSALLNQMSVVQIDVWDPTNGPKIFDSLNSRQEPMTIGDLIRNEVFSKVASQHPDVIERLDADYWQPFYKKFDQNGINLFDGYFFPFGLIKSPNLKKSEVYSSLRKDWDGTDNPEEIIKQLSEYQDAFIDLQCGTNLCKHSKPVAAAFKRLYSTKLPSSTFPFLMQLSKAVSSSEVPEEEAICILELIEAFLVRRATCGHEPTGLHSVFKRLWSDCESEYTKARVAKEISKHRTVVWPSTEDFKKAIETRNLYGVNITPFLILEFDKSLKGDLTATSPWIEHVLPTKPDPAWFKVFSEEQHMALKDRLANLLPLSSEMNVSLSNKPYEKKRTRYGEDSMFKSTRKFAEEMEEWTPLALESRGKDLSEWAAKRWPDEKVL